MQNNFYVIILAFLSFWIKKKLTINWHLTRVIKWIRIKNNIVWHLNLNPKKITHFGLCYLHVKLIGFVLYPPHIFHRLCMSYCHNKIIDNHYNYYCIFWKYFYGLLKIIYYRIFLITILLLKKQNKKEIFIFLFRNTCYLLYLGLKENVMFSYWSSNKYNIFFFLETYSSNVYYLISL